MSPSTSNCRQVIFFTFSRHFLFFLLVGRYIVWGFVDDSWLHARFSSSSPSKTNRLACSAQVVKGNGSDGRARWAKRALVTNNKSETHTSTHILTKREREKERVRERDPVVSCRSLTLGHRAITFLPLLSISIVYFVSSVSYTVRVLYSNRHSRRRSAVFRFVERERDS